jgi:hypothetical protein
MVLGRRIDCFLHRFRRHRVLGSAGGDKAAGNLAVWAFEPGLYGLLALAFSVCALLRGALQLDRNGFQAIRQKSYLGQASISPTTNAEARRHDPSCRRLQRHPNGRTPTRPR